MTHRCVRQELDQPDRLGSELARCRTRLYRFTDDPRHYVLAEVLEERFLAGRPLHPATVAHVRACLQQIRTLGRVPRWNPHIAHREGIDVDAELTQRRPFSQHHIPPGPGPRRVVAIVGAPRSGTSHLFNLLARQGAFAYFTTVSCWAWPTRNLLHRDRQLFTDCGDDVLEMDNKRTRIIPALVMPAEAEDVYSRALPVYQHLAGHHYRIHAPRADRIALLRNAVAAHMRFFDSSNFVTKSPFNSLRIPLLDAFWGTSARFVHIIREQRSVANSIRRNRFQFTIGERLLKAEDAWQLFVTAVTRDAPPTASSPSNTSTSPNDQT